MRAGSAWPLAVAVMLLTGVAQAQTVPPPPSPYAPAETAFQRSAWLIGFAIGPGSMKLDRDDGGKGGGAIDLEIGGMVTPRLAVVVHAKFGNSFTDHQTFGRNSVQRSQFVRAAGVRWFLYRNLWGEAGLGAAEYEAAAEHGEIELERASGGRAVYGTAAVELYQRTSFAFDFRVSLSHTQYDDNFTIDTASLQLGLTWY